MKTYVPRRREVTAVRLTWDNISRIADLMKTRAYTRGDSLGWIDLPGPNYRIARLGDWVVQQDDGWVAYTDHNFNLLFEEAL